jgi:hypothetical protein
VCFCTRCLHGVVIDLQEISSFEVRLDEPWSKGGYEVECGGEGEYGEIDGDKEDGKWWRGVEERS